jgi:hypothetical protein
MATFLLSIFSETVAIKVLCHPLDGIGGVAESLLTARRQICSKRGIISADSILNSSSLSRSAPARKRANGK